MECFEILIIVSIIVLMLFMVFMAASKDVRHRMRREKREEEIDTLKSELGLMFHRRKNGLYIGQEDIHTVFLELERRVDELTKTKKGNKK